MQPAVIFVSLILLLGITMILASDLLAKGAAKINVFLPSGQENEEYRQRRKRSVRNYGIFIASVGIAFAIYYFVLGGR